MSWRLRVRHSTTYRYADVVHASYNEARISPLDTAEPVHARTPRRRAPRGEPLPLPRLLGKSRPRVRSARAAHASSPWSARRWSRPPSARPTSTTTVAWDALERAGLHRPLLRVPERAREMTAVRRHGPSDRATAARRAPTPGDALVAARRRGSATTSSTRPARPTCRPPRSRCCAPGAACARTIAHLGARGAAGRRDPRPLRVRLPLSRRARRRGRRDARRARATRGSRRGSATGIRSTPPAVRRWPSATCSSPADATTPTSHRSRACTTAARATRST